MEYEVSLSGSLVASLCTGIPGVFSHAHDQKPQVQEKQGAGRTGESLAYKAFETPGLARAGVRVIDSSGGVEDRKRLPGRPRGVLPFQHRSRLAAV